MLYQETLEILGDSEALDAFRESEADVGRAVFARVGDARQIAVEPETARKELIA